MSTTLNAQTHGLERQLRQAHNHTTTLQGVVTHLERECKGDRRYDPAYRAQLDLERDKLDAAMRREEKLRRQIGAVSAVWSRSSRLRDPECEARRASGRQRRL